MATRPNKGFAEDEVDRFNREVPPNTPVRYWRCSNPWINPLNTRTRSKAWALGHGAGVVLVDDVGGGVSIAHVEVLNPTASKGA